jgi:hypothetical protein
MRQAHIPNAVDLGLNRTNFNGTFGGKGLTADQYGGVDVPDAIANLFDVGIDEQLVASCPLGGAWGGYGLDL